MTEPTPAPPDAPFDTFALVQKAMEDAESFLVEYDGELIPVTDPALPERFRIKYIKTILRRLTGLPGA